MFGRGLAALLVDAGLCGLVALFLGHLLVLLGAVFCVTGTFLRGAFTVQGRVTHHVAGGLLAASKQFVEETHVCLPFSPGELRTEYPL